MGPKVMTGFIAVDAKGTADDGALKDWIKYALPYVKTLPAK
jgi:hypothetical protein